MNQEQAQRKKAPNHAETDARHQHVEELGDFTTTSRVLPISGLAIVIGAVCAVLALVLLRLIGLFTNLFYFGTLEHRDPEVQIVLGDLRSM